MVKRPVVFFRR